ncbi:MAG TPA: hypothetical protein VMH28_30070 [Candidatus Acidoferrales bacterium]|nr:hypothetical protein [Candidatus Acidoferrales bacterium]
MATNGIEMAVDYGQAFSTLDKPTVRRRPAEGTEDFALAPLVDKIAGVIARGLVVAVKELEDHIASETRKVSDNVDRRLDTLQVTLQDLTRFMGEQRSTNDAVDGRLHELASRQAADVEALRAEDRTLSQSVAERFDGLSRDLGVHQEDIAALKAALCAFSTRVDALAERLDRQADAFRSMCSAYSQRETELEQLVNGLARLRAVPSLVPTNGL